MDSGENHHRVVINLTIDFAALLAGVNIGNLLVHVEEVAVALTNDIDTETVDGLREVEEYGETGVVDTKSLVAAFLGCTRCNVAGHEVAECRVSAFEIVVATFFGNIRALDFTALEFLGVLDILRHPDTTVVAERLRHKGKFRLLVTVHRDTCGVDLHIRGVGEVCALAVACHSGRTVATHSVGREEVCVTVSAGSDNHGVCCKAFELACNEILGDNTAGTAVNHNHIVHLIAVVALHLAKINLAVERAVGSEEELLAGLALCVECTRHLGATERTVGKKASVFTCEGYTLSHTLVDDIVGHLGQTIYVGFAGTVVTALYCVVEEAINRVSVVLIVLCSIDTTLCGN